MKKVTDSPVFVVGVPRSGTTVFSVKLAEACNMAMAPETHFMPEVYGQLKHLDLTNDEELDQVLEKFKSGRWFAELMLTKDQIKNAFVQRNSRDWPGLFATILKLFAETNGVSRYGEKTPGHYRFVNTLLQWYPDCRIIFLIRDPRAVVASNLRAPFSPSYSWFIARRWSEFFTHYDRHKNDSRVSLIRYEDFVVDPAQVLGEVKKHLGLEVMQQEQFQSTNVEKMNQKGWREQHLQKAAGAVTTGSVARWRKQLSPHDIWVTDQASGSGLDQCGYERENGSGQWWHFITHLYRFPLERLDLAIGAAVRNDAKEARKRSVKQRMLLFTGVVLDGLSLLKHRLAGLACGKRASKISHNKRALVFVSGRHFQTSSYLPLAIENEVLGLFVVELADNGYDIELVARAREQFFVAKRLIFSFGLGKQVTPLYLFTGEVTDSDWVEVFLPGQMDAVACENPLNLTAANAKEAAQRIGAFVQTLSNSKT